MNYLPVLLFCGAVLSLTALAVQQTQIKRRILDILNRNVADAESIDGHFAARVEDPQKIATDFRLLAEFLSNPRPTMQIVISLAILAAAMYIILSTGYNPQDKHWAYGSLGTILGYWLKSK